jgi:hypothetical protein
MRLKHASSPIYGFSAMPPSNGKQQGNVKTSNVKIIFCLSRNFIEFLSHGALPAMISTRPVRGAACHMEIRSPFFVKSTLSLLRKGA